MDNVSKRKNIGKVGGQWLHDAGNFHIPTYPKSTKSHGICKNYPNVKKFLFPKNKV